VVLPDPGAFLGQRGQRGRVGVVPGERAALPVGGVAGHGAHRGEVAQVLGARAGHLLGPLLLLPIDLDEDEAEGREEEHAGGEESPHRVVSPAAAEGGDQDDRAETAQHRDGVHRDPGGALVGLELRWGLQLDLTSRHLGTVGARAPQGQAGRAPGLRGTGRRATGGAAGASGRLAPGLSGLKSRHAVHLVLVMCLATAPRALSRRTPLLSPARL